MITACDLEDLAVSLRDRRLAAGLTQQELATRSGIHVKTIASFEHDEQRMCGAKLWQLCNVLRALEAVEFTMRSDHATQEGVLAENHQQQHPNGGSRR